MKDPLVLPFFLKESHNMKYHVYKLFVTPGVQKHRTMRNTKNDANLLGGNIKGEVF